MVTDEVTLQPRFKIELITKNRQHLYKVNDLTEMFPGVTTVLNVISKPYLVPWAAKEVVRALGFYDHKVWTSHGYIPAPDADKQKGHAAMCALLDRIKAMSPEDWWKFLEEAKGAHTRKKDAAADLGTRAHQAINSIIQTGQVPILEADIQPCVDAFLSWREKTGISMRVGDTKVASTIYGYGGSLDALGTKDGKLILIDFKTSNEWDDTYAYQVAAYAHAFNETYGAEIHDALILKLGKSEPTFEVKKIKNIFSSFGTFLSALRLYREKNTKQYEEVV